MGYLDKIRRIRLESEKEREVEHNKPVVNRKTGLLPQKSAKQDHEILPLVTTLTTFTTLASQTQEIPEINYDLIQSDLAAKVETCTRVDAEPAEPKTATVVAVLTEPGEAAEPAELKTGTAVPVLTDLAVSFLEAVEALLVTIKDERPPSFLTPQLKRDLKATEAALSAYRADLLPDAPESRAVGDSLANRYRRMVN
jgi:hypothetical protein